MRKFLVGSLTLGLLGCGSATTTFVHSDTTTLGRVVVYRNGVAYFERYATANDDKLTLAVPTDKVDDFLKSLNVVDARTGEPAPVAYPTSRPPAGGTGLIDMEIGLAGKRPHELRLSYVTEAPAWKPSYRVVLGDKADRVDLVGWAIVDNTSGEDWKNVRLGVGASSALAFRFDLRSIRVVERETLHDTDLFAADKASLTAQSFWTSDFVGSGPFRVQQWVPGSHMVVAAFDGYVLGRPHIDEIEIRFIIDTSTIAANILGGEGQVTLGKNVDVQQALAVRDQWKNGRIAVGYVNPIIIHPQFINPDPPVLADARFRSALMRGLNRQEMVDTLMLGLSAVDDRLFDPGRAEYEAVKDAVVYHPYDPRIASQMIEELGYTRGPDGGLRDTSGKRLSVEIRSTATVTQQHPMFAIADYWRQLGVDVQTNPVPQQLARDAQYLTTFPGFRLLRGDATQWDRMRISSIPRPENNYRGNNYNRYQNPELEALINRYFITIPMAARLDVVRELVHHVTGALNVMTLYFDSEPMFIDNSLTNVETGTAWNVHEWDLQR